MKPWWIMKVVKALVFGSVAILVLGFLVMTLWNAVVPDLFGGPVVTFWQALGLLVLSHILLRGFGGWKHGWRHDRWKRRFEEKLAAMTPEEREKFKQEWKERCGWYPGMEKDLQQQAQTKA